MGESEKGVSTEKRSQRNKKKIYFYPSIVVSVIALGSIGAYFYSSNKLVKSWSDKIYPNVVINAVDVGGKTKEEAKLLLSKEISDKVQEKKLILKANGKEVTIEYDKINPTVDINTAINKAFSYGKDENIISKRSLIKKGVNATVDLKFTYDNDVVNEYKEEFIKETNEEHKNAKIELVSGNITIIPEKEGVKLSTKSLDSVVSENLNSDLSKMVVEKDVETEVDEPVITSKMLAKIDGKIGGPTTSFNAGDWQRTTNLRVATGHINGMILMPGETFSYNDVVGERLSSRGFMNGAGFIGNKVVPTVGGGVCQISTTLYQAVSNSGILPVERHPHSMLTSYSKPSEDAAVAWEVLDYKFKNTYDFPIYIEGYLHGSSVTFNIYGNKESMGNKTHKLVGVTHSRGGSLAASSSGYLITYENGVEVERKLIAKDAYRNKG